MSQRERNDFDEEFGIEIRTSVTLWALLYLINNEVSIHFSNYLQVDFAILHSKIQLQSALKMD